MARQPDDPQPQPQTNIAGDVHGNVYSGHIGHIGDVYITSVAEAGALFANVPPRPDHFLGRADLVADLVARLCEGSTTALSAEGLPGVGKTTLAVMLAHHRALLAHFKDGVLWAGLGRTPDLAGILASWATALGIDVAPLPDPRRRAAAVANAIGQRHLLLVIDDAWQAEPALLLRCGGPNCAHLLTTRDQAIARAFATAAHVVPVPVLADGPAVALLQALAPEAWQADAGAVRHLAGQVGNLPLALELMGGYLAAPERAYFPELSAEALAELADPHRRLALARQRLGDAAGAAVTLQQTIALSLEDLPAAARAAFYALGAFAPKPDRFDRTAAGAVAGTDLGTLALLIARNLLEKEGDSLALHQTIADVARTQTPVEAIRRHRDHYLALVDEDREDWQRIETIYGQIAHAWQQQLAHEPNYEAVLRFVRALRLYQDRRGLRPDQLHWYETALHHARAVGHTDTAILLNYIGRVYSDLGEKQQALVYYRQALPLSRQVGDRAGEATTLTNIGMVYHALGDRQQARIYHEQALALRRQVGDREGEATTLNNIGGVYSDLGEKQQALVYYEQALSLRRQVNDRAGEAVTLNNIGGVYHALGDRQQALIYYEQALHLRRQVGDRAGEATTLNNIGRVYHDLGDKQKALGYYEQALALRRQVGDREGEATTLNNIGAAYAALGDRQQALDYYEQALSLRRQVDDRAGEATTLNNIGGVYHALGNRQQALDYYEQSLSLTRQVGDRDGEAATLNNIGSVYSDLGDKQQALGYYEQSLPLFRQVGNRESEAVTLNNIGRVYDALGDKQKALIYYEQSLPLFRQVGDREGEAAARFNIAMAHVSLGNLAAAEEHLHLVVALDEAVNHPDLESDRAALARVQALRRNAPS